jgi:hypothetical protein
MPISAFALGLNGQAATGKSGEKVKSSATAHRFNLHAGL